MGSGASNMSVEKLLSEEEVKALAGQFFDKSAFDALKDANGFITNKQYLDSAQKNHSGQLSSSQGDKSVIKDTNAGIVTKTIRLTRRSFSGSADGGEEIPKEERSVAPEKKSSSIDGMAATMAVISGGMAAPAAASCKSTRRSFSGAIAAEGGQRRRGNFPLIDVEDPINYKGPGDMIYLVFREFCPSGEMDSGAYTKLLRTAKLFDKPSMFPLAEAETLFRAAKQKLNEPLVISFEIFHSFVLPQIAERRGESEDEVADLISCCNAPPSALRRSLSVRIRGPDGANAVDNAEKPSMPSSTRVGRNASMRRSFSQLDTNA